LINYKLVTQLKLESALGKIHIDDNVSATFVDAVGNQFLNVHNSIILPVTCGKIIVPHRFFVVPDLIDSMIIGNDLYPLLGIHIRGVPGNFPSEFSENFRAEDEVLTERSDPLTEEYPADIRNTVLKSLEEELAANQQIPDGPMCTFPDAAVHINTSMKSMHKRPYKIPHALKPKVSAIINEWLERKVIEPAPPGSPWNWPLLAAPKKKKDDVGQTSVFVSITEF